MIVCYLSTYVKIYGLLSKALFARTSKLESNLRQKYFTSGTVFIAEAGQRMAISWSLSSHISLKTKNSRPNLARTQFWRLRRFCN